MLREAPYKGINELMRYLRKEHKIDTGIINISFNTIVDYLVLVVYLLKHFKIPKKEIKKLINNFESLTNKFRSEIPINVYNMIFYTDTRNKLTQLKAFISS